MRRERNEMCEEVREFTGGASVVVLPYPYRSGHFRIYTDKELPQDCGYTAQRRGGNLFGTATDERLLRALQQMEENATNLEMNPQESVMDTMLYQILRKNWEAETMDEALLARMVLDLDEDKARCGRVLQNMQPLLSSAFAAALRENRQHSVLTAIARQAVYHKHMHNLNL